MFKKIKEYLEYRKNKKIVEKELTRIAVTTLPIIGKTSANALKFINFITYVLNECDKLGGEDLANRLQEIILEVVKTFADKFETDETRLFEIVKYIANMNPDEIKKIIINAQVETLYDKDK